MPFSRGATSGLAEPELVWIGGGRSGWRDGLRELWRFREVLYVLAWRDVTLRYKQTFLGLIWAVVQPLATLIVLTLVLGRLARLPSDGLPYELFVYCALVPWTFFANGLSHGSNSLATSVGLITKVYFPRLLVPMASVLSGLVDLGVSLVVLVIAVPLYGRSLGWRILFALPLGLLELACLVGVTSGLAALNARYRDVRHAMPLLIQIWFFATPVAYPSSLVPPRWSLFYALNPMVGITEGFRWAIVGTGPFPALLMIVTVGVVLCLLVAGLAYFRGVERTLVDVV